MKCYVPDWDGALCSKLGKKILFKNLEEDYVLNWKDFLFLLGEKDCVLNLTIWEEDCV